MPPSLCQNATIGTEQNPSTHAITSDLKDGAIFGLVVIMQLVEVMLQAGANAKRPAPKVETLREA